MKSIAFTLTVIILIAATSLPLHAGEAPEGKIALKLELPEAFFTGTPVDHWSPRLEPEIFEDRPPYYVPEGVKCISRGKKVTSSCKEPLLGDLKQITDGNKDYAKNSLVELEAGMQWIQIDLEKEAELYAIMLWHFHEGKRVYFDIIVQLSTDKDFKDKAKIKTLFNNDYDKSSQKEIGKDNEYIENNKGRLFKIPEGIKARYVRFYSNGNNANDMNHYVEVEVFGK